MLSALLFDGLLVYVALAAFAVGLLMGWRRQNDGTHRVKYLLRALLLGLFVAFLAATWREGRRGRPSRWATQDWTAATAAERMQWRIVAGGVGLVCYMLPAFAALALTWKRTSRASEPEADVGWDGD